MQDNLDIRTLSRDTGISIRTIRYYLTEGLLPPIIGRGKGARYTPGHRDRLLLIRRLQDAHLPLAAIRAQLDSLDDAGVAALLANPQPETPAASPTSAADYVRQVLNATTHSPQPPPLVSAPPAIDYDRLPRSHWERLTLHPDIELHIRRPLSRADQRRLDTLLEQARRLFSSES